MKSLPLFSQKKEIILIVEDDKWVRSFLREFLEEYGYGIIEAEDALDAMEKYQYLGDAIDLVLCDLVLPKMSGRELCRRLSDIRPDLKILFMSGYPRDALTIRGIDMDNISFLSKPFNPEEILQELRTVFRVDG